MIGMIFQKISAIMLIACSKAVVDVCTVNLDNFKVFFIGVVAKYQQKIRLLKKVH